jgi:hypothetical protein
MNALNERDVATALEGFDPSVEVDWTRSRGPLAGVYHGHDGLRVLWDELYQTFHEVHFEPDELIASGDEILLPHTTRVKGRGGVELAEKSTLAFAFEDGRVVAMRIFQDLADARRGT